jgi:hypothetical protein
VEGGAGIGARGFHERGDMDFAKLLGDLLAPAEVDACATPGLIGRHARGFVVVSQSLDVEGDFAVQIVLVIAT